MKRKKKLCVVIGTSMNLHGLYRDQFKFFQKKGFEVLGIASSGVEHEWLRQEGVPTKIINFEREPHLFKDLISLINLVWFFTWNRFDIVNVSTPKVSLIGSLAAKLTFQNKIVYNLRGRAYELKTGYTKTFYEKIEKLVCTLSDIVISDSKEILNDVVEKRICAYNKIQVLNLGSSNGVDLSQFSRTREAELSGLQIRSELNLGPEDILILYSGRIRKDKGTNELVLAFKSVSEKHHNVHLLLQGRYEDFDPLDLYVLELIENHPKIYKAGWIKDVQNYFAAADIFAFPTHREGFGNVAIEASAMEVPVVAFDVVGCRESVEHNCSGILCGDVSVKNLEKGLLLLVNNEEMRKSLGECGRIRAVRDFDSNIIWNEILKIYYRLL